MAPNAAQPLLVGIPRRSWWLPLVCLVVATAAAAVVSFWQPRRYQSAAEVLIESNTLNQQTRLDSDPDRVVGGEERLIERGAVLESASAALGIDAKTLRRSIEVQQIPDTSILRISAWGSSALTAG
ncbi:MAG: Wzz/FepE/Etk N-terminal domain-containing protein, partial [Actinomycetota bacterium]|nr:Wzz/FepE/Etk N-terminal domain-containing protein [Actinomycetota bacterium]